MNTGEFMLLAVSITTLLFSISGFILGLIAYIKVRSSELSTHSIQYQPAPQEDLSNYFNNIESEGEEVVKTIPSKDLEKTLLQGFE